MVISMSVCHWEKRFKSEIISQFVKFSWRRHEWVYLLFNLLSLPPTIFPCPCISSSVSIYRSCMKLKSAPQHVHNMGTTTMKEPRRSNKQLLLSVSDFRRSVFNGRNCSSFCILHVTAYLLLAQRNK